MFEHIQKMKFYRDHVADNHSYWNMMPYGVVERCQRFKWISCFLLQGPSCSLKLEVVSPSTMLIPFYQTTWHHISENGNLRIHCHKIFNSHSN